MPDFLYQSMVFLERESEWRQTYILWKSSVCDKTYIKNSILNWCTKIPPLFSSRNFTRKLFSIDTFVWAYSEWRWCEQEGEEKTPHVHFYILIKQIFEIFMNLNIYPISLKNINLCDVPNLLLNCEPRTQCSNDVSKYIEYSSCRDWHMPQTFAVKWDYLFILECSVWDN